MAAAPGYDLRRATPDDRAQILTVAGRALGWPDGERSARYFAWKHDENPFGPSPIWVAEQDDRILGFRAFLRWELERPGESLRVVRAVDTATDPDHWGRGVFRALTTHALGELEADGVDAIFNLPNPKSLAGYMTMGWSVLGRPTLGVVPRSPVVLARVARARPAAEQASEPTTVGEPAQAALAGLPVRPGPGPGWATPRTPAYLAWRYSLPWLHYRAAPVRGGYCVFRVRRRGPGREVAICEWLSDEADPGAVRRLVAAAGDYGVGLGLSLFRHGALPAPRQGPVLAWRGVARRELPDRRDLDLMLGDVELF